MASFVGKSHSFFSVTNLWKNVCGPFITQSQQTYKFIVEKIDRKKVRRLGWSRMLWSLEIQAEFPVGCYLNLQTNQAKVEESLPKIDLGQPTKDVRLYAKKYQNKA
jgi:hypothetical protein